MVTSVMQNSTISQLLFAEVLPCNILRLVAEIDAMLLRLGVTHRTLTWTCDNIALFDLPGTRIAIAWANGPANGLATCLTLSVGPSPEMADFGQISISHHALCSRLVERLRKRCLPIAVLWHQASGPVTPDLLEDMLDYLPTLPRKLNQDSYALA